jgi:hypothetical protein
MIAVCPQSGRASVPRNSAVGWSSLTTTVLGSGASTASIFAKPLPFSSVRQRHCVAGSSQRLNDQTTSSAVMVAPLWNLTPRRSVNV